VRRLRPLLRAAALPTLSGVLYFLSWIGFGIWPLALVCLLPLVAALREATPRRALWLGAWMGFITQLGGFTWLVHMFRVFAFAPLPVALLGYAGLCAAQGLLFGVFAWLLRLLWLRTRWPLLLLLPASLCAVELLYPLVFQSYTGVALLPALPLVQIADLGGPLLLTALVAAINGALADLWLASRAGRAAVGPLRTPYTSVAAALLLPLLAGGYGAFSLWRQRVREEEAPKRVVGIAQPNVGEIELHQNPRASIKALRDQTAELHDRGAELVVWPEGGFSQAVDLTREGLGKALAGEVPVSLVAGLTRWEPPHRFWNSAAVISPEGVVGDHYDKIARVPFGEYIPLGDTFPILYQWSPMAQGLQQGESTAPLRDGKWLLATSICYEGILPAIVRATMADRGQGRPHLLVNLTNDSWYGAGHEQEQHLGLAVLRAIEHRRWLLRATSTGISAFVDSAGRVVKSIPRDTQGVAVEKVPMLEGTTLYQLLGDWPGWLALALCALGLWRGRGRVRSG
jgi:apolipoprotein N-acyltransferase